MKKHMKRRNFSYGARDDGFSDYFPLFGWLDKLFGNISRLEKNFKDLDELYEEVIEQHLNSNRPKSMEGDIIDLMLQLKKEQSTPIDLTLDNIKAILMDIFSGGTESSATAIIWAMTALIKNPKVTKKVQEEIRKSIGTKGFVNEDDIQNMPYFKAVVFHLVLQQRNLILSNLLYAFDWELPCGMKIEDIDTAVLPGITMHKKNDRCLVPKKLHLACHII
ncbi:hypothetical protein HAX54_013205 [Datura stramonium]|uniref:Cytochrome P450 n=1 Tax=Datura stramonium TaxID=4076 RepID=A0ABS8TKX4_DATST|nr:hypothetical protein [Datura stramonium]